MTIPSRLGEVYKHILRQLVQSSNAELDARTIITRRTPYTWTDIITRPAVEISEHDLAMIEQDLEKYTAHTPLSRIYGERDFWDMIFKISPETLDPRPDTETLIEAALKTYEEKPKPSLILDLGTGSGCILITLLKIFPNAKGIGIDKSYGAVKTAHENAAHLGFQDRAMFICGSWSSAIHQKFDLVVSNPPYISNLVIPTLTPEVRNHDPILALDGGEDGLNCYREIFESLKNHLNEGAIGLFEIGYDQENSMTRLVEDYGFLLRAVHSDLAGRPRVVEISCGDK